MTERHQTAVQDGQDLVQSVWQQGNAYPDAWSGRGWQNHNPLQAQAWPAC